MESPDSILQAIFDQTALGIAQISLDGVWLRVNDRYCQMLGYSESELGTKMICDITHPEDNDEVLAGRRQLLEGAVSSHSMEKRYIRKDGTVFWGRLNRSLVRDHDNQPKYFIAMVEDITEKIEAERALQERERQLALAQTAGHLGLWERDLRTGITVTSGEYAKLLGLTPDLLPRDQEQRFQLLHPGDRERVRAEYQESVERGHFWGTEFRVTWPDGSVHWLLSKGQVFRDDAGRPIRLAGVLLDITERKQAEEVRSHLAAIVEFSNDAIIGKTLHGEILSWNPGAERIYGYKAEEMVGQPISLLVPPDRPDEIPQILDRLRHGERFENHETTRVRKDGCRIEVSVTVSPIRDRTGAIVGASAIARDITERKRAESALRENEQHLKNAERLAHVGHFQWDLRSNAVSGSEEMYRIFGRPESYTPSYEDFVRMLVPQDRERVASTIRDAIEKKMAPSLEYTIITPNGDLRTLACTLEVLLDEDGLPVRLFGACQDITDSRRSQEEGLARQKLESLGVLANGIAHDFNNLLGSIMAQAELLKADLVAGLSPDGAIEGIKTVAIHGAEIVRALMTYAGQDQEGFFEPVDLSGLTAELLELLKVSISKHARLEINLEKNLPAVLGNAPQIRQVLMNLIINASEALGEKERVIRVTASRVTGGNDSALNDAANMPAGDHVRLEVSDNGSGMTEEAKAKIFDPFFTTKFAGRGLGLAVVQGIVRAHGGAIDVVSAPGQGATFQVLLPCASVAQNAVVMSSTAERSNVLTQAGATVLVVEDEEVLRRAVSKALRIKGFSVMEAADGSVAMDLVRTRGDDIDVILLDVTLPGTSSKKVFEEAQRMRASIKVVLTSAYDRKTVDAFFPGLRITQFIRKPFQLDELISTLRDALAVEAAHQKPLASTSQNAETLP